MAKHAFRNLSSSQEWLNCALWPIHKREWGVVDEGGAAAERGTLLHDRVEKAIAKRQRGKIDARGLEEEDAEAVESALRQTWSIVDRYPDAQVGVEVPVSLTYEPGSTGTVDLMVYSKKERTLFVADHKFGQGAVTIESTQVKGYAAMALAGLRRKGLPVEEVHRGIIQPALSDTVIEEAQTAAQVEEFLHFVNYTVQRQESGAETRPASDLSVCRWCPFKLRCSAHKRMLGEAMDDAEEVTALTAFPQTLARFYAAKPTIEAALKLARQAILDDPAAFPGWRHTTRRNGRKWDLDKFTEEEVIELLKQRGREDVLRLKTPAQVGVDEDVEDLLKPETTSDVLTRVKE